SIRDIKEEEVFFGEIPLMTDNGTFIINGTERVIVSQLHRSPGIFFKRGQLFVAKIIPYRGSWVEFEYDQKNLLYVRVGKRKFLATIFLRALGVWLQSSFHSKSFGSDSLLEDAVTKPVDALLEIYRKMRPGDPPTVQTAYRLLEGMFFDPRKFDFSRVGRLKFNIKMGKPEMDRIDDPLLQASDFFEVVSYVLKMRRNPVDDEKRPIYQADDIDHLGNRRVRAVGELLENQFRIGLERMERAIKEKMSIHQEMQTTMPRDWINAKSVTAAVREF